MKQYTLLPDQQLIPQPITQHETPLSFNEAEEQLNDSELTAEQLDETVELELALADRANKKEIRMLENELTRWTVLVDSLTGIGFTPEFDNQTLAVLRGRLVRYLMRSREVNLQLLSLQCSRLTFVFFCHTDHLWPHHQGPHGRRGSDARGTSAQGFPAPGNY